MASFGLEAVAEQTVSALAIFALLCEEAPVNGNSPWVSEDRLGHAPDEEAEEEVEAKEEAHVDGGLQHDHVLIDEDKVVEGDKTDNPDEMRVEQSTAHMNS